MKNKDWLAFLALSTIWGSSFLWIKIAVQEVGLFTLVAFRLLFGLLAFADDRLMAPRLLGILVGFAGIIILVSRDLLSGVQIKLPGDLSLSTPRCDPGRGFLE